MVVGNLRQVGGFLLVLRFLHSNKTGRHNVSEILLKVALNTINQTKCYLVHPRFQCNGVYLLNLLILFFSFCLSSVNYLTEILLKVALNTITLTLFVWFPLNCLSFYLRILITLLISSSISTNLSTTTTRLSVNEICIES